MSDFFSDRGSKIRVVASDDTWMEGEAFRQLYATADLPGVTRAVGLPDLHPGKGAPVGAAFLTEGLIYPHLVGSDIGCGMGLWQTNLLVHKSNPDRMAERLDGLDRRWDGNAAAWLAQRGLQPTAFDDALGTPGFGNHFAEVLRVTAVHDKDAVAGLGLDPSRLVVLAHTGSRGLGEQILSRHVHLHGTVGVAPDSEAGAAYLAAHDTASRWAVANRALLGHRVLEKLRAEGVPLLDITHNNVVARDVGGCICWLHRKGAAPSDFGPVVLPGSRGSASYLVKPVEDTDLALWSLAHGAGRKIARHEVKGKLQGRFQRDQLLRTPLGGRVVCGSDDLLWEEAPPAYKDIDQVVADLEGAGLLTVLAVMAPVVTFKASNRVAIQDTRKNREKMRDQARRHKESQR